MKSSIMGVGLLALLLVAGPASAAIVIDFEQGFVTGGTIANVAGAPVGTSIWVNILKVTIGAVSTSYDLFGIGPNGLFDTNGSAEINFNGAAFTLVGGVCSVPNCNGVTGVLVPSTTLVNGTGAPTILNFSSTTLDFRQPDTKAPTLLAALGIAADTQFILMDALFQYNSLTGASPWTVNSLDVANVAAVPEPTSILLLGTVMLGVTRLIRRRTRKT